MSASVHAPTLTGREHGSNVTYTLAPFAELPRRSVFFSAATSA
jgi:hypothetical protein